MKRLLAFFLLLVVGFVVLQQLLGDEALLTANANANGNTDTKADTKDPQKPAPQGNAGTTVTTSGTGLGVSMEHNGHFQWQRERLVPLPDGTSKKETVLLLEAMDSKPVREGLQQLDDVTVTLYDHGVATATVTAVQAFVELGRDGNGKPAISESKDIDLRTVVVAGLKGTKIDGLRIDLPRAKVHVADDDLQIRTTADDDDVRLAFAGKRSGTLVGKGLQARLPRDGRGALQRVDIDILSQPLLTTAGATLRAKGRLHYEEDMRAGTAEVSLQDDVELTLEQSHGVRVRGDQVLGWLLRDGKDDGRDAQGSWRLLRLSGSPAVIEVGDFTVWTPQVAVLPGIDGQPFWIRASGGESKFAMAKDPAHPERPELHGSSPRAIRVHLPSAGLAAAHRAYGFPQWSLAPLDRMRVVTLEGASRIDDGERTVEASRGIDVHQLDAGGETVIGIGHGAVHVQQRKTARFSAFAANGDDGFVLRRGRDGGSENWREHIDLGPVRDDTPDGAWRRHRYDLQQGDLVASGVGACAFDRADGRTTITLRAPDREIQARTGRGSGKVQDVRELAAVLTGEDVTSLAVAGMPAKAMLADGDETFTAEAPRIEQTSRASFVLLPAEPARATLWADLPATAALPRLTRDAKAGAGRGHQHTTTTAPRIDVTHAGNGRVLVDARRVGDIPAHAEAQLEGHPGGTPTAIALDADRVQLLPWALPPTVMAAHTGWLGGAGAALQSFTLGEPWLVGERVSNARVVDGDNIFSGSAARFLLSTGAACGMLLGDAETLEPAVVHLDTPARRVTARGAQVRIRRGDEPMLEAFRAFPGRSTFVLPDFELHETSGSGLLAHMRASCNGDIGLWSDHVTFGGPVEVHATAPDGSTVPGGFGIVARQLGMQLHPRKTDPQRDLVKSIEARDVVVDWQRCSARCERVQLDMDRHTLLAADPVAATVSLPGGLELRGQQITVDWQTLAYDIYRGSGEKKPTEVAR